MSEVIQSEEVLVERSVYVTEVLNVNHRHTRNTSSSLNLETKGTSDKQICVFTLTNWPVLLTAVTPYAVATQSQRLTIEKYGRKIFLSITIE